MENTTRGVEKNCGCCLVRPYVNDQVLTKIYNLTSFENMEQFFQN